MLASRPRDGPSGRRLGDRQGNLDLQVQLVSAQLQLDLHPLEDLDGGRVAVRVPGMAAIRGKAPQRVTPAIHGSSEGSPQRASGSMGALSHGMLAKADRVIGGS